MGSSKPRSVVVMLRTVVLAALLPVVPAWATVNPATLKITIYSVAVSGDLTCSNPTVIFSNAAGVETDFLASPSLGAGAIPTGTYPCVIIKMSDVITFTPAANDGTHCVAGQEYQIDVCRADGGQQYTPFNSDGTYGALTACNGNGSTAVADTVTMFLTTGSPTNGNNAFRRPTGSGTTGVRLGAPFVVTGSSQGTFVVDATNQVRDEGTQCGMNAPTFSFR